MTLITSIWTSNFAILAGDKRITLPKRSNYPREYDDTANKIITSNNISVGFHGEVHRIDGVPVFPELLTDYLGANETESLSVKVLGILRLYRRIRRDRLNFGLSIIGLENEKIEAFHVDPQLCRIIPDSDMVNEVAGDQNVRFNHEKRCPGGNDRSMTNEDGQLTLEGHLYRFCRENLWDLYRNKFPNENEKKISNYDYFEGKSSELIIELLVEFYSLVGESEEEFTHMINGGPDIVLLTRENGFTENPHRENQ